MIFSSFLQLTPIERYAMNFLEASLEDVCKEELKQAEVRHPDLPSLYLLNYNKSCASEESQCVAVHQQSLLCAFLRDITEPKCMKYFSSVCSGASGGCQERLGPGQGGGSEASCFV